MFVLAKVFACMCRRAGRLPLRDMLFLDACTIVPAGRSVIKTTMQPILSISLVMTLYYYVPLRFLLISSVLLVSVIAIYSSQEGDKKETKRGQEGDREETGRRQ